MVSQTIRLRNGLIMPTLGYGVWQVPEDEAAIGVREALRVGYRSIDTAAIYDNERGTGRGIAESGVAREEIFLTTKLWNTDQGSDAALRSFDESLERLGVEYVDLFLIHWPAPALDLYVETWVALQSLVADGRVRGLGVSNFLPEHLDRLAQAGGELPLINQVELHPRFKQAATLAANERLDVVTEAWSPLGQGSSLELPAIVAIAGDLQRTPAQVILRWHLQRGRVVIPKSVTPSRIAENAQLFDFELTDDQLDRIDALPDAEKLGPDPAVFV